jgi:(R,R)-butanediol dehydrogenase / meso-butanediol dehydrogenase / diacetyl reductase
LRIAATIEPTAVAVQAIKEGGLKFGENVAIFGAGPIGVLVAAAAKAAGASKIIVSDLSEVRLKKALEMGATDVIKSDQEDAVKKIKELVPGGVDVSFEVAGVKPTFDQAIEATKARGTMVIVAIYGHPIEFNPMQLTNTGVKITSTIAYSRETFQQTVDLVTKGSLVVEPVITKEITIDQVVSDGFEALINDKAQAKILINVDGEDD